MILSRLLIFAVFFLGFITSLCRATSRTAIQTGEGSCLTFGAPAPGLHFAALAPCSDSDPNQMINIEKLSPTHMVFHDNEKARVMCYNNTERKLQVFNLKDGFSWTLGRQLTSQEVVKTTLTRRELDCQVTEVAETNGFYQFRFGASDGDTLVWRGRRALLLKARHVFCGYDDGRRRRFNRGRGRRGDRREAKRRRKQQRKWRQRCRNILKNNKRIPRVRRRCKKMLSSKGSMRKFLCNPFKDKDKKCRKANVGQQCRKEKIKFRRFIYKSFGAS